jgi:ring-1,2-phenylacetyl-CoA epoxidase subunit PaaC
MHDSLDIGNHPAQRYLLRIADTCLVQAQRLGEWCGHAPVVEEDIALTNMALDLIGQARGLYTLAGTLGEQPWDEDQLAFLRNERDYFNVTLVELPRGDFAFTVLRNAMMAGFLWLLWQRLCQSSHAEVAALAGKAVKEARYHLQHNGDWVVRLGGGTPESHQRLQAALDQLWRYHAELFNADAIDSAAAEQGLGPDWADLHPAWSAQINDLLAAAHLVQPVASTYISTGKQGRHSEHMGFILAEMQYLQRAYPGGAW